MRRGSRVLAMRLVLAVVMVAGSARAADCQDGGSVRSQAECIADRMSPDVIDQLYRLALTTVPGQFDPDHHLPPDFSYIAREAGETARHMGPKPLVEMASSQDLRELAFAAHAIWVFVRSVHHGYSHRQPFDEQGDAKVAEAKPTLLTPCKRLAAHHSNFISGEGDHCLREIEEVRPLRVKPESLEAEFAGLRGSCIQVGCPGGLRATDLDGPRPRAHRTSKAGSKAAPKKQGTPPAPPPSK